MPNPSGNKVNEISSDTSLPATEKSSTSIGKVYCGTDSILKVRNVVKSRMFVELLSMLIRKNTLIEYQEITFHFTNIKVLLKVN